ncbi:MAG: DUF4301 family protein [Bacteroidales bacterium]|nr:MAG: DUF4301 family protein [Bacteroidales bacterium]
MFSKTDMAQFAAKKISIPHIELQLRRFNKGFPFLNIRKPAVINDGILALKENELKRFVRKFENSVPDLRLTKFVPASGAASRMFKSLFECYQRIKMNPDLVRNCLEDPECQAAGEFMKELPRFAFYEDLEAVYKSERKDPDHAIMENDLTGILEVVLSKDGLDMGSSPKGLIKFHRYPEYSRAAVEEHLVEGVLYARNSNNRVHMHFTVSPEHLDGFKSWVDNKKPMYESMFDVKFRIEYSVQEPSTDTIAVDVENRPFRLEDGSILFRPGGHGALLENLNEIDSDVVFIKNIDNVAPDRLKDTTVLYKKALAGILLEYQEKIFHYLALLTNDKPVKDDLYKEIEEFLSDKLCITPPISLELLNINEKGEYFRNKLNRPVRVCGMVRNEGEPGGGPFWTRNADGTLSLQIAETSQIDTENPDQRRHMDEATHFNPVDLVCGIRDFNGKNFNLTDFRDPKTGFISIKSKDGKTLKALELPGLWNGAMSDWNTIFVEVPVGTFNPVKTVNDLLRPVHQPE